jgi:hypothetical protein
MRTRSCARPAPRLLGIVAVVAGLLSLTPAAAQADDEPVLRNGGFEQGLTGWRTSDAGSGTWSASRGVAAPLTGFGIPAPPQGEVQAVVDQFGPGSHLLYRDIRVTDDDLSLVMTLWYDNDFGEFLTPATLQAGPRPNQQLRIDLMRPGAPLRSLAPADVLATVFRTHRGDPAVLAPRVLRHSLAGLEDRTVRLRIAEVDNQFFFRAGVDAVRLVERDDDSVAEDDDGPDDAATRDVLAPRDASVRYVR